MQNCHCSCSRESGDQSGRYICTRDKLHNEFAGYRFYTLGDSLRCVGTKWMQLLMKRLTTQTKNVTDVDDKAEQIQAHNEGPRLS